MAKIGVSLKIDVTKIDKSKLFEGKKGKYLDATVFINTTESDEYGNHGMITQSISKEEKQAGKNGAILGNCRIFWDEAAKDQGMKNLQSTVNDNSGFNDFDNEIPF